MDLLHHFFRSPSDAPEGGKVEETKAENHGLIGPPPPPVPVSVPVASGSPSRDGASPIGLPTPARWRTEKMQGGVTRYFPTSATPDPPLEVVLVLDDVLARIPTHGLQPGLHDPERELRFPVDDLTTGLSRGRVTVPLSRLAQLYPDLFAAPTTPAEEASIPLPLQKLIQQISRAEATAKAKSVSPPATAVPGSPLSTPAPLLFSEPPQAPEPALASAPKSKPTPASAKDSLTLPPVISLFASSPPPAVTPPVSTSLPVSIAPPAATVPPVTIARPASKVPAPAAPAVSISSTLHGTTATSPDPTPTPLTSPAPGSEGAAEISRRRQPPDLASTPEPQQGRQMLAVEANKGTLLPISAQISPDPEPKAPSTLADSPVAPDSRTPQAKSVTPEAPVPPSDPEQAVAPPQREQAHAPLPTAGPNLWTPPIALTSVEELKTETPAPHSQTPGSQIAAPPEPSEEPALKKSETPEPNATSASQAVPDFGAPFFLPRKSSASAPSEPAGERVPPPPLPFAPPPRVVSLRLSPALTADPAVAPTETPLPARTDSASHSPAEPPPAPLAESAPSATELPAAAAVTTTELPPASEPVSAKVAGDELPAASSAPPTPPAETLPPPPVTPAAPREQPVIPSPPTFHVRPGPPLIRPPSLSGPAGNASLPEARPAAAPTPAPPLPSAILAEHHPTSAPAPRTEEPGGPTAIPPPSFDPPPTEAEPAEVTPSPKPKAASPGFAALEPEIVPAPSPEATAPSPVFSDNDDAHEITPSPVPPPPPPPTPAPSTALLVDQEPLQALFMTDEELDLPKVSALSAKLPGVTGCIILAGEHFTQGGEKPAGLDANTLRALSANLVRTVEEFSSQLPAESTFTLYGGNRALSLFARPAICLCVVHAPRGFLPGVRERLAAVADTLSRGFLEAGSE